MTRVIRTLQHGDPIPDGEPRRFRNAQGYIRLRWKVACGEYVECYEHRFVMGLPPDNVEVHHRNKNRQDNRPENLDVVTPAAHGAEHRTLDHAAICNAYEGRNTTCVAVAAQFGTDPSVVYRILARRGIPVLPPSHHNTKPIPDAAVTDRYDAGMSARAIARDLGVSDSLVAARFKKLGLRPRRPGRPKKVAT